MCTGEFEFGYPYYKRKSIIDELIRNKKQRNDLETYEIEYRGSVKKLPLIEVSIKLPVYRTANGRTISLQKEHIAKYGLEDNYFTEDPYSQETQKVQDKILQTLIAKEELEKTFKVDKVKQVEPLICTDDGVVVNGNRRLCAWRKLYLFDKDTYKHFETVKLAVLPDHDEQGIQDLEISLQIKKHLRAEYSWHAVASLIKKELTKNTNLKEVAKRFNKTQQDISLYVECYSYAEKFLQSIGAPDQWSKMDDSEYALKQIVKSKKNINDKDVLIFEKIVDSMLEVPAQGDRLYKLIPQVAKNIDAIKKKFREILNIKPPDEPNEIDILLGGGENEEDIVSLINALKEQNNDFIVNTVRTVVTDQENLEIERKTQTFILDQVAKAATCLNNAIGNLDSNMKKEGLLTNIESIEKNCKILKDWAKQNENSN